MWRTVGSEVGDCNVVAFETFCLIAMLLWFEISLLDSFELASRFGYLKLSMLASMIFTMLR